jgi:dTDP-4-dehydrorhamnose 3,5-epimerase-like enzyme
MTYEDRPLIEDICTSMLFEGKVSTFHLRGIEDDRGILTSIDFQKLGFHVLRAFLIQARPGASRGGHGHNRGRQILVRISGEIKVELFWQNKETSVLLGPENNGILIASPVWSRQTYHGHAPCLMAFCDTPYDPSSYLYEKHQCTTPGQIQPI